MHINSQFLALPNMMRTAIFLMPTILTPQTLPVSSQSGEIDIVNHTTGDRCHLKFAPYSYFSRDVARKVRKKRKRLDVFISSFLFFFSCSSGFELCFCVSLFIGDRSGDGQGRKGPLCAVGHVGREDGVLQGHAEQSGRRERHRGQTEDRISNPEGQRVVEEKPFTVSGFGCRVFTARPEAMHNYLR